MTETMIMEPDIKIAMGKMGLEERSEELLDILDKIELDKNLAISAKQEEMGLTMTLKEAEKLIAEEFKNDR